MPRLGRTSAITYASPHVHDGVLVPLLEIRDATWHTSGQSGCLRGFSMSRMISSVHVSPTIADAEAAPKILPDCQL